MKTNACTACTNEVPEIAFFCPNCATQVKCKKCSAQLVKNAKACISCGTLTESIQDRTVGTSSPLNTIKFRETKEERTYEVAFTNDVSKEVSEVVANMIKNNLQNKALQSAINSAHKESEGTKDKIDLDITRQSEIQVERADGTQANNFPPLHDIEMTLDCNEVDWIAIYAFYISKHGANTFSKDQVYEEYNNKRHTETRRKNFSRNWKTLFNSHITTVKEDEFRFRPEGIEIMVNLLTGKKTASPKTTSKKPSGKNLKPSSTRKTIPKNVAPEEFDVLNKKIGLENFYKEKQPGGNTGFRILIIAYYITKINDTSYFTDGNIEYAYRALGLNGRPNFLHQTLINLANGKMWFEKLDVEGKNAWKLTRIGETFVEDKLPENKIEK